MRIYIKPTPVTASQFANYFVLELLSPTILSGKGKQLAKFAHIGGIAFAEEKLTKTVDIRRIYLKIAK